MAGEPQRTDTIATAPALRGRPGEARTDTIAAIATAPGVGAVGIVKISGPDSGAVIEALCRCQPGHREVRYTAFYGEQEQVLDRGLALFFQGPDSHTGEDVAELHGHGGPVVMNLLLQRVLALGARYARPGEFSERAFLNNKIDLLQAEAVADLISSASEQAARSAVRSMEGAFSARLAALAQKLLELRAFVEATLDFPEEEVDALTQAQLHERLTDCRDCLGDITARAETGRLLAEGVKIAIVGKPNAGKSSLLNRLAGTGRAIVSAIPGTTRDTVEQRILIDGVPVHVIDTAGIRKAGNQVEREGIRRARDAAAAADLALLITDASTDDMRDLRAIAAEIKPTARDGQRQELLYVFNKIDVSGHKAGRSDSSTAPPGIYISAKTGAGIDALKQALKDAVAGSGFSENTFIAHTRHLDVLHKATALLEQAAENLHRRQAPELFADDLTRVQQTLGALSGAHVPDDLLGEIFSHFCIGK